MKDKLRDLSFRDLNKEKKKIRTKHSIFEDQGVQKFNFQTHKLSYDMFVKQHYIIKNNSKLNNIIHIPVTDF